MQRLTVEGFGPIKGAELPLNDLMVFIGPQASGKSTISKLIYFFKSLRELVLGRLKDESSYPGLSRQQFDFDVGVIFPRYFSTTTRLPNFEVRYEYGDNAYLTLTQNPRGNVVTNMSPAFAEAFDKIIAERTRYQQYLSSIDERTGQFLPFAESERLRREKEEIFNTLGRDVNSLFADDSEAIYIPAGRGVPATLSADQLSSLNSRDLDFLNRNFIRRLLNWKDSFPKDLDGLIEDRKRLPLQHIDFEKVRQAKDMINSILKGEYWSSLSALSGGGIYIDDRQYVEMKFASSGQQEIVWILLSIFKVMLEDIKVFMVVEEPEAHLYPETQKEVVELIALMLSDTENRVIITTHSPYILTSLNNLIYAGKLGKGNPEVDRILPRRLWVDTAKVEAFFVEEGGIRSIKDDEDGLLRAEEIDRASKSINDTYDRLADMEWGLRDGLRESQE